MTQELRHAKLVEFGNGGDTVYLSKGCTCSGYGTPEKPHAARPHDGDFDFPDSTPVVDVRPAIETDAGFKWVFHGPLVNVDLPDDDIERCPTPDPLMAVAMAENEFGKLLAIHHVDKLARPAMPGPLDSVSIRVFVEGWKQHGARIGHYVNNAIVWD